MTRATGKLLLALTLVGVGLAAWRWRRRPARVEPVPVHRFPAERRPAGVAAPAARLAAAQKADTAVPHVAGRTKAFTQH